MMLREVREVREVIPVSLCNPLREVTAGGAREVREVNAQPFEFIAGGNTQSAAARALYTTYIGRPRLLGRRACLRKRNAEALA